MSDRLIGKPIRQEIISNLKVQISSGRRIQAHIIFNPGVFEAVCYKDQIAKLLKQLNLEVIEVSVQNHSEARLAILECNKDPLGSCFLCRPLNCGDEKSLIEMISPSKDADMLTSTNKGKLVLGDLEYLSGTAAAIYKILSYYNIDPTGKDCLVMGRSISVGLPIALLMIKLNACVSVVHSKISQEEIRKKAHDSDIVICATGARGLVTPECLNPASIVIDCGYLEDGKGDLGFDPEVKAYTPVPGGIGPITIAILIENAFKLIYDLNK